MNRRERRGGGNDGVGSEQVDIIVSSWTIFSDGREIKKNCIFSTFHNAQRSQEKKKAFSQSQAEDLWLGAGMPKQ